MEILIFGAGSLGSLLGGLLAGAHDVTLVGRDPHIAAVRERGLRITGVEERDARPAATTDGRDASADLALVTVKAYDTEAAARALAAGDVSVACSLQNGMGNEEVLATHLDAPVLAGTTTCGARLAGPGHVEWLGRGSVTVGPWRPDDGVNAAERVVAAFRAAGVDAAVTTDARGLLWEKLAINAGINPVTALARVENGALAPPGDLFDLATAAGVEAARVARAAGASLSDSAVTEAIADVARDTARNRSSMHQDVAAGRRTEVDAINGYVVDRAAEEEESVPVNRTLATLIRGWEAGAEV
ncbi:ketopantoate reductase family protein [Haloplanus halophilus]|uniref:ketopantoate reductase family protein n=1 Tax=Haloplanus halophilus TaxID=2949993 RepID=UPI00203C51A8|nr:2-dehydropantoate 2-reductase [Haloplanus sp. GDY1]